MEKLSDCKLFDILLFIAITKTDFINKYERNGGNEEQICLLMRFRSLNGFVMKIKLIICHIASKIIYNNYITFTYINRN